jgi:putative SOS response-associated peptidase YedK
MASARSIKPRSAALSRTASVGKQIIEEQFDTADWQDDWNPRYNIAPIQPIPVIRQHPKEPVRQISAMRWGLVLSSAKDTSGAARMINARSETAATKPAFRDPLKYRRCLIPADAFYEWKRNGTSKQPYCFEVNKGGVVRFRWIVRRLEGRKRELDKDLLNSHHDPESGDLDCSRANASDSPQGRL